MALVFNFFFSSNSHAKENENPKRNNKLHIQHEQKAFMIVTRYLVFSKAGLVCFNVSHTQTSIKSRVLQTAAVFVD